VPEIGEETEAPRSGVFQAVRQGPVTTLSPETAMALGKDGRGNPDVCAWGAIYAFQRLGSGTDRRVHMRGMVARNSGVSQQ
jgi:hypothetical protein